MSENLFTAAALQDFGQLPIAARLPNGISFKSGLRNRVAVLGNFPVHQEINGEIQPIQTTWQQGSLGEFGAAGLKPRIFEDELQFIGQTFRHKVIGVGMLGLDPLSVDVVAKFPPGYAAGNKYIREAGIYSHRMTLHERNQVKEDLVIQELPADLSGDYLVIAAKIFDADFPVEMILGNGFIYKDSLVFVNGVAIDANQETTQVRQYVREFGGSKWLLSGVPTSWLASAAYPVIIDPTTTLQPDETAGFDAWGQDDATTTNRNNEYLWGGAQNGSNRASWIKFDLSSITDFGAMIDAEAALYLMYAQSIEASINTWLSSLRRNWSETGVCWAYYTGTSGWSTSPGISTSTDRYSETAVWATGTGTPSYGFKTFDVTTQVEYWLNGTRTNYGFVFYRNTTGESTCGLEFWSSAAGTSSYRPKLTIEYVSRQFGGVPIFFG